MYVFSRHFQPQPRIRTLGSYLLKNPRRRRRGLRGLGDITIDPNPTWDQWGGGTLPLTPPDQSNLTPISPAIVPNGPYSTGVDILNQMRSQAILDTNPTDYVSPSAAIAAGLDPTTVNAAWAAGLARYPTQAAAIAAGIAPGVVTQFWNASRSYAAVKPSGGISTNMLLIGAGIIFGVPLLLGGGRRRR